MTARKGKRRLDDWPSIGNGPIVMKRQGHAANDRKAVLAWGADRIVQYTRATRDSYFLALYMRLHQPTTPAMDELLADILDDKVTVKPRPGKHWLSPDALAVFRHWHDVHRAKIEEGDAGYLETVAKVFGSFADTKRDRTDAAWRMSAMMFDISVREAKKLYWSK